MDRKDFIERSAMAALAVLAGGCAGSDGITGPGGGQDVVVTLADYPALTDLGGVARISGVSPPLALVHEVSGDYAAFSLVCPHQGTIVQWVGSEFWCPNHGARFDAHGTWTGGQKTTNLRSFATAFDPAAGTVLVTSG